MKNNNSKFINILDKILLEEIKSIESQNIFEENIPIGYESGVDITNKHLSSLDKKEIEIKKKQNKIIKKATKNIDIDKKNIKKTKNLPKLNISKTKSTSENLPKPINSLDDILKNIKSLFNNIKNITLNSNYVKEISNALNQSIKFTSKIPYKIQSIIKNINKNLSSTGDLKKSENDLKKLYEYVKQNYELDPYVVNLFTNIIILINKSYSSSVQLNNKKPIDDPFKGIPKAIVRDPIKTNSTDYVIKNVKDIISKTQIGKDVKNIISISKQLQSNYKNEKITHSMAQEINNEIKNKIINDGRSSYFPNYGHILLKSSKNGEVEIYNIFNGDLAIYKVFGNKPNLFGNQYTKLPIKVLDFGKDSIKVDIPITGIGVIESYIDSRKIFNLIIDKFGKNISYTIREDEINVPISLSEKTRTLEFELDHKVNIYVKPTVHY